MNYGESDEDDPSAIGGDKFTNCDDNVSRSGMA